MQKVFSKYKMPSFKHSAIFCLLTFLTIILTYYLAALLHIWIHEITAWILGFKDEFFSAGPWPRKIGFFHVVEIANYNELLQSTSLWRVALVAIMPTLIAIALFVVGIIQLMELYPKKKKKLYYFWFWFTLMNLGQVLAYVALRSFALTGDIEAFSQSLAISPWFIFAPGTLFVLWGIWRFLCFEFPKVFKQMNISTALGKDIFFLTVLIVLLGFFGSAGFSQGDLPSRILSSLCWAFIPILFLNRAKIIGK